MTLPVIHSCFFATDQETHLAFLRLVPHKITEVMAIRSSVMDSFPVTNTAASLSRVDTETESLSTRDSIAQVINALTGSSKTAASLSAERISEDILFAALVHRSLKATAPNLADRLIAELPGSYSKQFKQRQRQPIFSGVNAILKNALQKGEITRAAKRQLIQTAFSKAQLDSKPDRLGRKPIALSGSTDRFNTNIDQVVAYSLRESGSSRHDLRSFRRRIDRREPVPTTRHRSQKRLFELIDADLFTNKPQPEKTVGTVEKTSERVPDYNDIQTGPNEFVYRPCNKDGKISITLPLKWVEHVKGITLQSTDQRQAIHLPDYHLLSNDGRVEFSADHPEQLKSWEGDLIVVMDIVAGGAPAKIPIGPAREFHMESIT